MIFNKKRIAAAVVAAAVSSYASADTDTTASLKGMVNVDNAKVTIEYEPTGLTKTRELDDSNFSFSFLPVGGPYTLTVTAPGYETIVMEDVYLALFQDANFNLTLVPVGQSMEKIEVYGQAAIAQGVGTGTSLDRYAMNGVPTVNRSIADFARLDPRIAISSGSTAIEISAMGANNRFNDFQIDGVSFNDPFGLNSSGFATARNPVSMDFVDQVSVDITPYDVSRQGGTGATISVVTKSGSNDFHGSAYYTSRDESYMGDNPDGSEAAAFEETIKTLTFSGPIIEDTLFFFLGYEKFEYTAPFLYGPSDSEAVNKSEETRATFDQIAQIAQSSYGFNPGNYENLSFPETAEEYVVKLDWNINDYHSLSLNYSNKDEVTWNNTGLNRFETVAYTKPPETERFTLTYTGEITDDLNVKATYTKYDFTEDATSAGGLFPEMSITGPNGDDIVLGGEKYRGANYINVKNDTYSLKADYSLGSHIITAGIQLEDGAAQNMFLARYNGEIQFDSIEDFEDGRWSYLRFQVPSAGLEALDTITADFDYEHYSYYLQDAWSINEKLDVQFGIRVDSLETPTKPAENPAFVEKYGYSNAQTFDYTVVQPRASFSYDFSEDVSGSVLSSLKLRGGYGLFMGRFPNVWLGNAYSRPGPLSDYPRYRSYDESIGLVPTTGNSADAEFFWLTSPNSSYEIAQPGTNPASQFVDPDFEAPSSWRGNLAVDMEFVDGSQVTVEYNQDRSNKSIAYEDVGLQLDGTLADGRPYYRTEGSYMFTNDDGGEATSWTVTFNRDLGEIAEGLYIYAAYTNTDAEDVWGLTSAQAESAYGYQPAYDIANVPSARSAYMVEHNFLLSLDYSAYLFGDNETRFSMIFSRKSGEPYSITMDTGYDGFGWAPYGGNDLAYIPTGADDANVVFTSDAAAAAVMDYVQANGLSQYAGTHVPRNSQTSPWISRVDVRVTQEINLPEFLEAIGENKAIITLDLMNVGNMIDDGSGWVREVNNNVSRAILVDGVDEDGRYLISGVDADDNFVTRIGQGRSTWEARLGFKWQF